MKQYVLAPKGFDPSPHLEKAAQEISHYTAIMVFDDHRCGSGIFVKATGFFGILTAHHVSKLIFDNIQTSFYLIIKNHPHTVRVRGATLQQVVVGEYKQERPNSQLGPDLSFIIIRDVSLLALLESVKSFYFLETKDLSFFEDNKTFKRLRWQLSGSPKESWKYVNETPTKEPDVKVDNLVAQTTFQSYEERNRFDFFKFRTDAGIPSYPMKFGGMSGGGMWLTPLEIDGNDINTVAHASPVLAGIIYHESATRMQKRTITGHGYCSIYTNVLSALRSLKK